MSINITVEQGSITDFARKGGGRTAIVNAANVAGLGGGGVDGAIHKAAGARLRAHIEKFALIQDDVRIPVGDAIKTPGFQIPVDDIIHVVGPIFPTDDARTPSFTGEARVMADPMYDPEALLLSAITRAFILAKRAQVKHLALPAISCGVFGCPFHTFARCLHQALLKVDMEGIEVCMVLFMDRELEAFKVGWRAACQDYKEELRRRTRELEVMQNELEFACEDLYMDPFDAAMETGDENLVQAVLNLVPDGTNLKATMRGKIIMAKRATQER